MRSTLAVLSLLLLSTACASSKTTSGMGRAGATVIDPEFQIVQLSHVPIAARHVQGGIPIKYQARVANRSAEWIELRRIDVQSVGIGAYTLVNTSRPFKTRIEPEGFENVEFWVPATVGIADMNVVGANGPVTLRITAHFDSAIGQFDRTWIQQVNAMPGRDSVQ